VPKTTEPAQQDAVNALEAGAASPTLETLIAQLEEGYQENIARGHARGAEGKKVQARIYAGMASYAAALLAKYYQDTGNSELFDLWEYRRKLAFGRAFSKGYTHAKAPLATKHSHEADEEEDAPDFLIEPGPYDAYSRDNDF
jgi:hypothetical protein